MSTKIQMNQTQETKSEMLITCNQILKWPLDNQKKTQTHLILKSCYRKTKSNLNIQKKNQSNRNP